MGVRESLAVVLSNPLRLLWVNDSGDNDINVGNRRFLDGGLGRSIGFYDWLRTSHGAIIGARTSFLADSGVEDFREQLTSNSCVKWDKGSFELFFSLDRKYDSLKSCDQEFGIHRILASSDGDLLITYDVGFLDQKELEDLKRRIE